jgi:hypothetical protein
VRVVSRVPFTDRYAVPETHKRLVRAGQSIKAGEPFAEPKAAAVKKAQAAAESADDAASVPELTKLLARVTGKVRLVDDGLEIDAVEVEVRDHTVDATDQKLRKTGEAVVAGQKLTSGVKDPHDILRIEGTEATQRYLLEEVQTVYRNQGVTISDKHIETIVRQMLRWVRVDTTGDTDMLPNQLIDRLQFQEANAKIMAEGGEPSTSKPEILGVTRSSLNTDSFLAKASFQETARVLTEAAILGEVDYLRGLKENVIIGRLIPARLDISAEGRELLGLSDLGPHDEIEEAAGSERDLLSLMTDFPGADAEEEESPQDPLDISFGGKDDEDDEEDDEVYEADEDEDSSGDASVPSGSLTAEASTEEADAEGDDSPATADEEEPDASAIESALDEEEDVDEAEETEDT